MPDGKNLTEDGAVGISVQVNLVDPQPVQNCRQIIRREYSAV